MRPESSRNKPALTRGNLHHCHASSRAHQGPKVVVEEARTASLAPGPVEALIPSIWRYRSLELTDPPPKLHLPSPARLLSAITRSAAKRRSVLPLSSHTKSDASHGRDLGPVAQRPAPKNTKLSTLHKKLTDLTHSLWGRDWLGLPGRDADSSRSGSI